MLSMVMVEGARRDPSDTRVRQARVSSVVLSHTLALRPLPPFTTCQRWDPCNLFHKSPNSMINVNRKWDTDAVLVFVTAASSQFTRF
jgi:hypothetical protein